MWTYEEEEGVIENITVIRCYEDGEYVQLRIRAHKGYVIVRIDIQLDEEGNLKRDEQYPTVIYMHPDFEEILNLYKAYPIEDWMKVV